MLMARLISEGDQAVSSMKISNAARRSVPSDGEAAGPTPKSRGVWAFLLGALVLLAAFTVAVPYVSMAVKNTSDLLSRLVSTLAGESGTSSTDGLNYTIYAPLIQNGTANVSYPPNYPVLSSYVLGLVNSDRATYGIGAVALGDSRVAQQHADSMLRYDYFSHVDTQGFKPYMRYSLLGGRGAVEENIAYIYTGFPHYTTTSSVQDALKSLEYSMMYNDSQCCSNGHRYNILSALHNEVSVGVAYSSTSVYFVEDFVNSYIDLNFSVSGSYYVAMTGAPLKSGLSADAVYITYDATPSPLSAAQLNSLPHEYGPGSLLGGVLPPCSLTCQSFAQGITVHADTWIFTASSVSVGFSLHDFVKVYGPGVYNVYLVTGTDTSTAITSISVFVG